MKIIQGIRIKNYRVLKDISLGAIYHPPASQTQEDKPFDIDDPLTPLTVVIGRNGYGKSTFCDALGFIVDCLKSDAEQACISRGGFDKIVSADSNRTLEFQIRYGSILYTLCIRADDYGVPFVYAETLSHTHSKFGKSDMMNFFAQNGQGKVVRPNSEIVNDIRLVDPRRLVLSTLGNLTQFPDIVAFRQFLDSWYLCFFKPEAARNLPRIGLQRHLSSSGDNLANVVQYWQREHPGRLEKMLKRVLGKVLGLERIDTSTTEDGRLLLRFYEKQYEKQRKKPFYAAQMSDGTLKLIAYMILLGDPSPPPLVCFEEPESALHHKLLVAFVEEIRRHTVKSDSKQDQSQFFITTHQPYLVDALSPQEVWILEKGSDGFAKIRRASKDPVVRSMVEEGMPLGALWFSEYLDEQA